LPINDIKANSGLIASTPEQSSVRQLQGHDGRVYSLIFTPDARQLFSAGEDGRLRVWQIESDQSSRAIASGVENFAVINSKQLVTVGDENLIRDYLSPVGPKPLRGLQGKGDWVYYDAANDRILASDSSHRLIATSQDGMQQTVLRQPLAGETLGRVAVSPDGRQWAVVVGLGDSRWLELSGLGETRRLPCESIVHNLEFSPDGRFVLIDQAKDVQVVDAQRAEVVARWKGHRSTIWDLALSPDGRYVATVSKDRQAKIWEWPSGQEVWSQMAHAIETECVTFSPNGRTLATCGADRLLRLWRWQEDMLVLEYPLADWPAEKLAFTADGSKLLVLSRGRLRIYDASQ
jgi:WD40 repeat protein